MELHREAGGLIGGVESLAPAAVSLIVGEGSAIVKQKVSRVETGVDTAKTLNNRGLVPGLRSVPRQYPDYG